MSWRFCTWIGLAVMFFSRSGLAGYADLKNWSALPQSKSSMKAGLAGSYDRSGGNNDFSQFLSPSGLQLDAVSATIADLTGPGEITRFWMPHLTANRSFSIKMYFDGETTPRIDTTSNALLGGTFGYMKGAFLTTACGGQVLYEPIPFKNSLRIETLNKDLPDNNEWSNNRYYYQFSYHLFSSGGPTESYTGTLTGEQQTLRNQVSEMLTNLGQNPAGENENAVTLSSGPQTISPQGSIPLASLVGSGAVRKLCIKLNNPTDAELEGLMLQIRYDGVETAAVNVPVAHFFGAGFGRASYKSLPLGTDSTDGYYSYWPMPFRQAISIDLYNTTAADIDIESAVVEYENRSVAADERYFHADLSVETTSVNQPYHTLLSLNGTGHYVGNLLWLAKSSSVGSTILEGDDIITADGETLYGTGLEDAYNGGYYFNWVGVQTNEPELGKPVSAIRPFHGLLYMNPLQVEKKDSNNNITLNFTGVYRVDMYRWHIPDVIPFENSLDVKIENYGKLSGITFGSTAFYYLATIPGDANGDRIVDIGDLGILAANYGCSGKVWGQGDFNNDGKVDVGDLGILAANYNAESSGASTFVADDAKIFKTQTTFDESDESANTTDSSLCSPLGLSLILGGMTMCLMLVRPKDHCRP
jgi:hypothetical protein